MNSVLKVWLITRAILTFGDINRRVQVVIGVVVLDGVVLVKVDLSRGVWRSVDVLMLTGNVNINMGCGVLLGRSETVLAVSFNVDVNLFLNKVLLWSYDSRKPLLFSLDLVGKLDLTLDVSLFNFCDWSFSVLVRRREDAKGNWDARVEVQIAGCQARECSPRTRQEKTSCFTCGRRGVVDSRIDGLRCSLCSS